MTERESTVTPSWLNEDLLTTVLQEEDPRAQINVISFSSEFFVPKGNNYACLLIRVNIGYERNGEDVHISLVVKTPHGGESGKMLDELEICSKECLIYKELLPIMNKMINKRFTPKDYFCPIAGTLILEDLGENYVTCDRLKQLDFDHCYNFMKSIATFHALSLKIKKQDPELMERVGKECIFHESLNDEWKKMFYLGFRNLATVLEDWGEYENIVKFIRSNEIRLWENALKIHNGGKTLTVLNHGDAWTNNMLFKHDDTGKVDDVMLIDLQLCKLASPALDLVTFLTSSAQEDVKEHRLPELYSTYIESFNSTLEAVGYEERLSPEQFQEEIKFVEDLGQPLLLLTGYVPIILCDKKNVMSMDEVMESWRNSDELVKGEGHLWKIMNGKKFKEVAKYTLKKMEQKGFFTSS